VERRPERLPGHRNHQTGRRKARRRRKRAVEAFEGRNLIFVDEGHKGFGGEAWRKYRDALGTTGFTFEYSTTFPSSRSAGR